MKRLMGLFAGMAALLLLASCAGPSNLPHAKSGQVVEMNTYTVQAPEGGDWRVEADRGSNTVVFLKQKQNLRGALTGSIQSSTMISVHPNMQLREKPDSGEQQLADDVRDAEEKDMVERGVKMGEYTLEGLKKGSVVIDGKKLYTMSYRAVSGDSVTENVLYLYFPPEFKVDNFFYEFLISEARIKGAPGPVADVDLAQIYPVLKSFKSFDLVQVLLRAARPDEDAPALIQASWKGDIPAVRELLKKGVDVNITVKSGSTPLHYAALSGHRDIIGLLIDKGANVNLKSKTGTSVLQMGILDGIDTIELLLDKGADINAKDDNGWTALELAASLGRTEAAKLLIERGADINHKDRRGGTALALAVHHRRGELATLLMEKGAEVNTQIDDGWTPLMDAADSGNLEMVRLLLEKGADTNHRSNNGWTALMAAALYGRADIAKLLIEKGADVNAKNTSGGNALQIAKMGMHEEVVRLLKEAGAK